MSKIYIVQAHCTESGTNALIYGGVVTVYSTKELAEEHISKVDKYDNRMHESIHWFITEKEVIDTLDNESISKHNSVVEYIPYIVEEDEEDEE